MKAFARLHEEVEERDNCPKEKEKIKQQQVFDSRKFFIISNESRIFILWWFSSFARFFSFGIYNWMNFEKEDNLIKNFVSTWLLILN